MLIAQGASGLADRSRDEVDLAAIHALLDGVCDPEIPVLTIADLGILRDVRIAGEGVTVVITPTYSGCPAMRAIEADIKATLTRAGCTTVAIETQLTPAWTTDWLSAAGREKLRAIGIAPPALASQDKRALRGGSIVIACPQCGAHDTELISQFGSTTCKALYRCRDCLEPFDYFKCI